ncbi:hypothetical protein [Mycolicibacterium sp. 050158]|jgi:hypothetical protein|uniref:hypothetical protein n=1 Tax=Mycolicibacterium sp. 050158 TaxID=3090602 RepID=UPI00299EC4EE|nr:hypothetical protein [Mycolicibacterium sp. 050158]MDX1891705.1 hypothetical protein [Mycolicibacterium sp. 050158]
MTARLISGETRALSEIVGLERDSSLRLASVGVEDGMVAITLTGTRGVSVQYFADDDARRVVADLLAWSDERLS